MLYFSMSLAGLWPKKGAPEPTECMCVCKNISRKRIPSIYSQSCATDKTRFEYSISRLHLFVSFHSHAAHTHSKWEITVHRFNDHTHTHRNVCHADWMNCIACAHITDTSLPKPKQSVRYIRIWIYTKNIDGDYTTMEWTNKWRISWGKRGREG